MMRFLSLEIFRKKSRTREIEPHLEFIKIDDGKILARVTRDGNVAEATIHTIPPEDPVEARIDN